MKICKIRENLALYSSLRAAVNTLSQDVQVSVKENKNQQQRQVNWQMITSGSKTLRELRHKLTGNFQTGQLNVGFGQRYDKPGGKARDCWTMVKPMEGKEDEGKKMEKPKRDIECFNCHQKGHHSSNCPHCAMFCLERPSHTPYQGDDTPVCGEARDY